MILYHLSKSSSHAENVENIYSKYLHDTNVPKGWVDYVLNPLSIHNVLCNLAFKGSLVSEGSITRK